MNPFIEGLEQHDLNILRNCSKADLHNHFALGGSRSYIKEITGIYIPPIDRPLSSMSQMDAWSRKYIGSHFDSADMRKLLIEATFQQAKNDGVTILEIGEDVWGLGEFFCNDINALADAFYQAKNKIVPNIELRLQIGMSRHCTIDYLEECLSYFWGSGFFFSIDLYGDEFAQPIEKFIPIYRRAKKEGLRLKAHVGEWGNPEDVQKAVELLELDEVQHGIAAAYDERVMRFLADNRIRINITPTSNVLLGRVASLKTHPISLLYRSGVDVTINSDDVLIFDSDVSKEYLRLYEAGCLSAKELDDIRQNGLKNMDTA